MWHFSFRSLQWRAWAAAPIPTGTWIPFKRGLSCTMGLNVGKFSHCMGQRKRREFAWFYCTALLKLIDILLFLFLCVRWCTPGFVMGMNAYLDNTPEDQRTLIDIENLFDGHCKYPLTQDDATQRLLWLQVKPMWKHSNTLWSWNI